MMSDSPSFGFVESLPKIFRWMVSPWIKLIRVVRLGGDLESEAGVCGVKEG